MKDDDVASALSARILEQEHFAYSEAIGKVLSGACEIDGRCVKVEKMIRVRLLRAESESTKRVAHSG